MSANLSIVNVNGDDILAKLLRPFYSTIEPAFLEHGSQIILEAAIPKENGERPEASAYYTKDGGKHVLGIDVDYHPFITSSRIKIIAGISIALTEGTKHGQMRIRFGKELLAISVQTILKGNHETVILTPDWK
jgi:hypothetical protein